MARWSNADRTPLAVIRANAGFTRTQAAVYLDVALNTLGRYETGQGEMPLDIAEDMAILYKVPFDDIRQACASLRKKGKRTPQLEQIHRRKNNYNSINNEATNLEATNLKGGVHNDQQ